MELTKWDPFCQIEDMFGQYTKAFSRLRRGSQEIIAPLKFSEVTVK
jgi:hypothetical protein